MPLVGNVTGPTEIADDLKPLDLRKIQVALRTTRIADRRAGQQIGQLSRDELVSTKIPFADVAGGIEQMVLVGTAGQDHAREPCLPGDVGEMEPRDGRGRGLPGRGLFRSIFFMPYVLSEVNVAIMWMLLYNPDPDRGLLNAIVVGLGGRPIGWLSDPNIVLFSIFIAITWKYFGFHMLLYLAGLQNIPIELEEAARIDGASNFQNFFYITLPLLGSTIRTSVYLSVLGVIQQFIPFWVMTKGGPVNASEMLATYMYRFGFIRFQLGYGSAVAIYMFILCLIFSLIYLRLTRQPDYLTGL